MSMESSAVASIVVAAISLFGVIFSLSWNAVQQRRLTELQSRLAREQAAESKAAQAATLVARFRDPLLESAFDLQSRLYNVLRTGGTFSSHRGRDDYYIPSTLFLVGQFFGWVEILRRDMLYSDIANIGEAQQLLLQVRGLQDLFSKTTGSFKDRRVIFRVVQRAIGEIMIDEAIITNGDHVRRSTIGYATFSSRLKDDEFHRWFGRFEAALDTPPAPDEPDRLRAIQRALIDLINFLDPGSQRFPGDRSKLSGDRECDLGKKDSE